MKIEEPSGRHSERVVSGQTAAAAVAASDFEPSVKIGEKFLKWFEKRS